MDELLWLVNFFTKCTLVETRQAPHISKSVMVISLTEKWDMKRRVAMFFMSKTSTKTYNEILTVPF